MNEKLLDIHALGLTPPPVDTSKLEESELFESEDYKVDIGEEGEGYVLLEWDVHDPFSKHKELRDQNPVRGRVVTVDALRNIFGRSLFPPLAMGMEFLGHRDYLPYIPTEEIMRLGLRRGDRVTFRRLPDAELFPTFIHKGRSEACAKGIAFPTCEITHVWGIPVADWDPKTRQSFKRLKRHDAPKGFYMPLSRAAKWLMQNPPDGKFPPAIWQDFRDRAVHLQRMLDIMGPMAWTSKVLVAGPGGVGKSEEVTEAFIILRHVFIQLMPDLHLVVIHAGERPEEKTNLEMIAGESDRVHFFSTYFDDDLVAWVNVGELGRSVVHRLIEKDKDVVVFIDSISQLAGAYTFTDPSSGGVLPGGHTLKGVFNPRLYVGTAGWYPGTGSHCAVIASALNDNRFDQASWERLLHTVNVRRQYFDADEDTRPAFDMGTGAWLARNANHFLPPALVRLRKAVRAVIYKKEDFKGKLVPPKPETSLQRLKDYCDEAEQAVFTAWRIWQEAWMHERNAQLRYEEAKAQVALLLGLLGQGPLDPAPSAEELQSLLDTEFAIINRGQRGKDVDPDKIIIERENHHAILTHALNRERLSLGSLQTAWEDAKGKTLSAKARYDDTADMREVWGIPEPELPKRE